MLFLADSYFHQLDKFAVHFTGEFGIRWYGLAYAVGFVFGWWMVRWIARRGWSPLPAARVGDFLFAVIIGVMVGGRVGYALFYQPQLFYTFSSSIPFWDLLAIWNGGMASHGGMIGVIIAICIWGRLSKIDSLHLLDVGALASTPGLFFGRIANFINAELWGKPLPPDMQSNPPWWSIKYPQEIFERWEDVAHPSAGVDPKAYADLVSATAADFNIHAVGGGDVTPLVVAEAERRLDLLAAQFGSTFDFNSQFYHHLSEIARDAHSSSHDQVVAALKPMLTAYYPSQLIQAFTDGPLLLAALVLVWLAPRKPGVVGSWFLIIYGLLRIATEFFRQHDTGVQLTLGLSRGQTLSALMSLAGMFCLFIASRHDAEKLGGLFTTVKTEKSAPSAPQGH